LASIDRNSSFKEIHHSILMMASCVSTSVQPDICLRRYCKYQRPCASYVVMAVFEIRTLSKLESTRVAQASTNSVRCEAQTSVNSLMIVTIMQHTPI
jgi:hypothetical protein